MKVLLVAALFIATAVVAVPVVKDENADEILLNYLEQEGMTKEQIADVTKLVHAIEQVETTLITLEALVPHSIKKRQTTVNGSARNGNARINLNHRSGRNNFNANLSHGRGGTNYGAGFTHRRGGSSFGANVGGGTGGGRFGANYGRTWNNGRTSFGVNAGRNRQQGTHAGFRISHRF